MVIKLQLNCIAASLFQRCIGGLQRPIFMQHYGFSAVLVDFSAPLLCSIAAPAPLWWILTHQSGSSATRVDSSASFLCKIWVPPSQEWFPAIHFFCIFQVQCRTGGFQRPKHRGSSPARLDSSASGLRNMCEQRSCTQDTSKQVLRRSLTACSQRQGATAVSAKWARGFP